jgi:DNA polymerase elongation subunit (family B)
MQDALDSVEDMREHDVPQHWRWAIDNDMRAGYWYTVTAQASVRCGTQCLVQLWSTLGNGKHPLQGSVCRLPCVHCTS